MLLIWHTKSRVRGRSHPCSTSFPIAFSNSALLRLVLDYLWFPHGIIVDRSDFLVASSIGDMWYWEPLWITSIILRLSSWWWNRFAVPLGFRNSDPEFRGFPWWDSKILSRFPLKAARIILLCNLASCVCLNYKTGGCNYLDVLLMNWFIVVTSHDVFGFCLRSRIPFSDFSISWPLVMAYIWFSISWLCSALYGVVSLSLLYFCDEKLGGFGVVLACFFLLPFVSINK